MILITTITIYATGLFALLTETDISDAVIMQRVKLHSELGITDNHLVSFSDIAMFEKHLNICVKFHTTIVATGIISVPVMFLTAVSCTFYITTTITTQSEI